MIQITQEESNAVNALGVQAQQIQAQLKAIQDAQMSVIKLLEEKYKANFNTSTSQFEPWEEEEK